MLIVGDACRQIHIHADGAVRTIFGGAGYEAWFAVPPSARPRSFLLAAPSMIEPVSRAVGKSAGRLRLFPGSREFEDVRCAPRWPLHRQVAPAASDLVSLIGAVRAEGIRRDQERLLVAAYDPVVNATIAKGIKHMQPLSTVFRISDGAESIVPGVMDCYDPSTLVFVDVPNVELLGKNDMGWLRDHLVVLDKHEHGVDILVDGVRQINFSAQPVRDEASAAVARNRTTAALAGAAVSALEHGLTLEEGVALGIAQRQSAGTELTPADLVKRSASARAAHVFAQTAHYEGTRRLAIGIFVVRDGELLLAEKDPGRALLPGNLRYLPGGKVESGESLEEATARELQEETGLMAEAVYGPCGYSQFFDATRQRLYDFVQYIVRVDEGDPVANDDVARLEWRPLSHLRRDDLFPLTWAQLKIFEWVGSSHDVFGTV